MFKLVLLVFDSFDIAFLEEFVGFEDEELGLKRAGEFFLFLQPQPQFSSLIFLFEGGQVESYPLFFSLPQQGGQSADEFVAVDGVPIEGALGFLLDEDVLLDDFPMGLGQQVLQFVYSGFFEVQLGVFVVE